MQSIENRYNAIVGGGAYAHLLAPHRADAYGHEVYMLSLYNIYIYVYFADRQLGPGGT